ncbi:hypothetical protein EJV47_02700 [Hymenobacter gummosus]|uniref:Lipocalin-like domain-containing protein n=1 Tax=Hymenobacter gummosus TaxID=1776032 RepID=A0A3S0H924_9BACT|nr:hypothetical protein [Hymenobacter gummosus]RTQ53663.1 hypothetical protein EJV47_02700 [Hymenobacter gummosus]
MKTTRFALLALAALPLLTACEKDKEKVTPKTPTELLVGKNWVQTACTVSPAVRTADGRLITNVYAERNSFDRDDLWHFEKPNTMRHDEGATKRNANDPQSYDGTWSLEQNDRLLRVKVPGLAYDNSYDVQEIGDNTMRLSGVSTDDAGVEHTYSFTYTKQ